MQIVATLYNETRRGGDLVWSGGGVVATARRSYKTFIKRGEREIRRTRIDREGETERKTEIET